MKRRVLCCFMALLMMVMPLAGAQAAVMPAAQSKAASSGAITALKVSANPMAGEKISFFVRLNRGGRLLMKIMDAETGKVLSQFYNKSRSRGSVKMAFSGRLGDGSTLSPGKRYLVRAVLKTGAKRYEYTKEFTVLRPSPKLTSLKASSSYYYPDSNKAMKFTLNTNASGRLYAALYDAKGNQLQWVSQGKTVSAGSQSLSWSGRKAGGDYYATGKMTLRAYLVDESGATSPTASVSFTYDAPPTVEDAPEIWEEFTKPVTVVNANYLSEVYLTSRPGGGSRVGYIFGQSVGVKVLKTSGQYSYVETTSYRGNRRIRGYIKTSRLKTITPTSPFGILVDKKTQRAYVYRNGAVVKSFKVSTGKSGYTTPSGTYVIPNRKPGFSSNLGYCRYAVRVIGRIYFHQVPGSNGNYAAATRQLGKPASSGCIRVPVGVAEWIYKNIPNGTVVIIR